MGTVAVQLAKSRGAQVVAIDSTKKLDMLLSIGADRVIDYMKGESIYAPGTYDVILDFVGKSSFSDCIRSLKDGGVFVLGNPGISSLVRGKLARKGTKKVIVWGGTYKREDLLFLKNLIEEGRLKAVIDRRYPLEQTAEAHRYVETGQKVGNVVITVAPTSEIKE